MKSKNVFRMLASMFIVGLFVSLPFMTSLDDFITYLKGTLFVHQNRYVQGRPFLFYISYFYKIELFQIIPIRTYAYLAMVTGWVLSTVILLIKPKFNKYILGFLVFVLFYLFTPVLNRTYLIWGMPLFMFAALEFAKIYKWYMYYLLLVGYWLFYYWYLAQWKDGFHIWHP